MNRKAIFTKEDKGQIEDEGLDHDYCENLQHLNAKVGDEFKDCRLGDAAGHLSTTPYICEQKVARIYRCNDKPRM